MRVGRGAHFFIRAPPMCSPTTQALQQLLPQSGRSTKELPLRTQSLAQGSVFFRSEYSLGPEDSPIKARCQAGIEGSGDAVSIQEHCQGEAAQESGAQALQSGQQWGYPKPWPRATLGEYHIWVTSV